MSFHETFIVPFHTHAKVAEIITVQKLLDNALFIAYDKYCK